MINRFFLLIILIIGFLFIQYIWKKRKDYCDANENRIKMDVSEVLPGINYKMIPDNTIHYLFWTGGYDSTFRLCQILLMLDRPVQPIYLMCGEVDNPDGTGRNNLKMELEKMKTIRDLIIKNNPHLAIKFMPTHYIVSIQKDKKITSKFKKLHKQLGYFSRSINQYERAARYSYYHKYPIEIGLDKCGTGLDEATEKFREGYGTECKIKDNLPLTHINLEIFKNIRFPIAHLTKKEMKMIALQNNFYFILKESWSCWFPKFGQPCGLCEMCKQRII